eukprot:GILI01037284.1.p1 GENE.GILI01037284.1~~GILI01037284.1.p1  ORF type:complete len:234 (+),score=5.04 GILI01037284.1:42-704(+)
MSDELEQIAFLSRREEWLAKQIQHYKAQVESKSNESFFPNVPEHDGREQELLECIDSLQKEYFEKFASLNRQESVLQRIAQNEVLLADLYQKESNPSSSSTTDETLSDIYQRRDEIVSELLRLSSERNELELRRENLEKEYKDILVKNRALWAELSSRHTPAVEESSKDGQQTESDEAHVRSLRSRNICLRHILQGLILESGVDWSSNEHLFNLLLLLEK